MSTILFAATRLGRPLRAAAYIDGAWRTGAAGAPVVRHIDPFTEEYYADTPICDAAAVDSACRAAAKAHITWAATPPKERAVALRAVAELLRTNTRALAEVDAFNVGRGVAETEMDLSDCALTFDHAATLAEALEESAAVALPDDDYTGRVDQVPIGPVGCIASFNYPLLMMAWKVAPALAAGCSVVFKPSENTPFSALEAAALIHDAGILPDGLLNVVTGDGATTGNAIARHPLIRKVTFTGSAATGRRVMAAAAEGLKPVALELGGKSPAIIFEDANIEHLTEWVMFGVFGVSGQICSANSRLLVHESIADKVVSAIVEKAGTIAPGDPLDDTTRLGPIVNRAQYDKVMAYLDGAKAAGIKAACGGGRMPGVEKGLFVAPTVFVDPPADSAVWREEIFGPVLCVKTFADEDEAVAIANDTEFGLAAAIFSEDMERLNRVTKALDVGAVWHNCSQLAFPQLPWGGVKASGIGRELGPRALDPFLQPKAVTSMKSRGPMGWY